MKSAPKLTVLHGNSTLHRRHITIKQYIKLITFKVQMSPVCGGEGLRKLRPTASRLRPDYLADFLHEKIWRTFYIEVLPDFLAYYFPRFHVQKDNLLYLNITKWPILTPLFGNMKALRPKL
jgi:hypothetical protein